MTSGNVFYAVLIGIIYLSWPIIGKWTGASGSWLGTLACLGTLISVGILSGHQMTKEPLIGIKMFLLLTLVGCINGVGVYIYSLKVSDPHIPTGMFVTIVCIAMVASAPVIDWIINHQTISIRQAIGIALAVGSIYLIKK